MWPKMGKSKRLASPWEENFQTYEKDNNTNKKNCIYLEAFRMSTKQLQFFLQLQSGIQLTEQQLSSYKLHQRQLKMKKTKNKQKKKTKKNYRPHI